MNDYQLIVIGAGPAGYTAALRAAKLGLKTAVIEAREVGGTCLNRGCVPTKTLLHSSDAYKVAISNAGIGVHIEGARVNMGEIFAYKRHISETLSQGVERLLRSSKVPLLHGCAQITAPHTVRVLASDGTIANYTVDNILVATGSVPERPPIPGLDLPGVMTSDELLDGAGHLYKTIIIIGGGVIGVEFATFYAELGCAVTVIEGKDRLLPNMDRELSQNLAMILKKQNVHVFTSSMVKSVEKLTDGYTVNFTAKDVPNVVTSEAVLCAIGRKPNCEGLFADGFAPEMNNRSIKVDERYQTSIEGVYAIGDVSSSIQLAHVAAAQGLACVDMLCGREKTIDMSVVPSCIYCRPEIAVVGITEAEAKEEGISVKTGKCVMGANARVLICNPGRSFMKVVANAETGELLGAQLMCPNATDIISQISVAITNHLTAKQLLREIRPHPTFEEALSDVLLNLC